MSAWNGLLLLGTVLAVVASESVLLYASTALADVGLKLRKFLLASSLAAVVWAACCCGVALLLPTGRAFSVSGWAMLVGGLIVSWLMAAAVFAWIFSTSARRALLVSTYQLILRALSGLLVGATAVLLLRLFLAASAPSDG